MNFSEGDRVRMTRRFRTLMRWHNKGASRGHIREFGRSEGSVVNVDEHGGVRVEWGDTGLRYTYSAEYLERV